MDSAARLEFQWLCSHPKAHANHEPDRPSPALEQVPAGPGAGQLSSHCLFSLPLDWEAA